MPAKKKVEELLVEDSITEYFKKQLEHRNILDVTKFISTGSTLLDYAIANRKDGGIPVGRITEISGDPSSGKSLLAYHILANTQKMGGVGVYIDAERSAHKSFMTRMGINMDDLLVHVPLTIEDVFEYILKIIQVTKYKFPNKEKDVTIVVDSVSALQAQEDVEVKNEETSRMAPEARAWSRLLRKNIGILDEGFVTVVFINQLRDKMNTSPWAEKDATTGGRAIPFYSSIRIKLVATGKIKESKEERVIGSKTEARVFKNKIAPPFRSVKFPLMHDWGVQNEQSILDYLGDRKVATGAAYKNFSHNGKEISFKNSEWNEEYKTNTELREAVDKYIEEDMVIPFNERPDLNKLDINTESLLEVQQLKDSMEESE